MLKGEKCYWLLVGPQEMFEMPKSSFVHYYNRFSFQEVQFWCLWVSECTSHTPVTLKVFAQWEYFSTIGGNQAAPILFLGPNLGVN